jgi:hypothetical protein
MPNLKLNLLCGVGGHNHFGADEATIFKVSKEPRIKWIARIRLRHEDQACRVRPWAGPASLSESNYLIVEAQLVRHLAGAHLQLVVGQTHRVQESIPARVILKIG